MRRWRNYAHRAHTRLALRHAPWSRGLLGAETLPVLVGALAAIAVVFTREVSFAVAAAAAGIAATVTLLARLVFDAVYENAPPADRSVSESARQAPPTTDESDRTKR